MKYAIHNPFLSYGGRQPQSRPDISVLWENRTRLLSEKTQAGKLGMRLAHFHSDVHNPRVGLGSWQFGFCRGEIILHLICGLKSCGGRCSHSQSIPIDCSWPHQTAALGPASMALPSSGQSHLTSVCNSKKNWPLACLLATLVCV